MSPSEYQTWAAKEVRRMNDASYGPRMASIGTKLERTPTKFRVSFSVLFGPKDGRKRWIESAYLSDNLDSEEDRYRIEAAYNELHKHCVEHLKTLAKDN